MFKRIMLLIATNIAIMVVISIILSIFHVQPYLNQHGLDYQSLLIVSAVVGFAGAFISLLMSKWMAKMAYRIQIIQTPSNAQERFIFDTVKRLSTTAGIRMPEIGIYQSQDPNAFATGWKKNDALVAVSSSLLDHMNEEEVTGVLGHELSHIANGDMVTLTLIQGVLNTFVFFLSRVAAYAVTQFLSRGDSDNRAMGSLAYYGIAILFQIIFGILASMVVMAFSRWREYRADRGSVRLAGKAPMLAALKKLQYLSEHGADEAQDKRGASFNAMKIRSHRGIFALFSSHPPLKDRIHAIERGV